MAEEASNDYLDLINNAHAREQNLEAEEPFDDADSALGTDTSSISQSISESIYEFRTEHGRTYHAYKDGRYVFPNDDREADRLDLQHHMMKLTYQCLALAPIDKPKNALDIGTGTGIWAIEFADKWPDCRVIGTDLSPGFPERVPPNLEWLIDDAEDPWPFQHKFDYIHLRLSAGCFENPARVIEQAFAALEPGGYLEFQDYGLPLKCQDGTLNGSNLERWGEIMCEAARRLGRPMGTEVSYRYKGWMQDAGLIEIEERQYMWPSNGWPKDPVMKELGRWNQTNIKEGLEGFCLALLTRGLGWTKEEVDVFVAKVTTDIDDKRIHAYFPMPVCWGRKPF